MQMWQGGRAGAARPAGLTDRPCELGASDRRVKAQAARLLARLARRLLEATGRAYRAGIVGLPQVESVVSLSAKLRGYALHLVTPGGRRSASKTMIRVSRKATQP